VTKSFLLFDDARPGGQARLYHSPHAIIRADRMDEVEPALHSLQGAVRGGAHVAGFLAYEAGYALDPALASAVRKGDGPLLWFGLFDSFEEGPADQWLPDPAGALASAPHPLVGEDAYLAAAERVREHLLAGDFYQANLTFPCEVAFAGSPAALFAQLRKSGGGGWGALIRQADGWLLSVSPEQFFTLRDGVIEARPMKGTAGPLMPDEVLTGDPKSRAENLMIVDLLRNDLARVAETGSVAVPELFAVERYPTVSQMVSRVTARLRKGLDAVDVLRTIFPCGSVTGAPKVAAMLALRALEPAPRGAYCGAAGWIEPGGDAAFNVLIRTLEVGSAPGRARLGLGSGLVVDSVPRDEWAECLSKGAFVTRAAPVVDLIETMRFDPREGVPGAARLLLSPTGAMAVEVRPLPVPAAEPLKVRVVPLPVAPDDYRLRFKTTDRAFYDDARRESGADEVIFADEDGFLTEGSFTSVFIERDGQLLTPPLARGLLPGVLRDKLIAEGRAREADLREDDLRSGFLLGNMLRGLMKAELA
jgi:para-aminobenzoate synthetase/4-amino-4-deoxychorismate lyase